MADSPSLLYALYGVASVGAVLGAARAFLALKGTINIDAFAEQIVKLVRYGNEERALKLCAAAPKAQFVRMLRPALIAALDLEEGSPAAKAARAEQAFDVAYASIMEKEKLAPTWSILVMVCGVFPALAALALTGAAFPMPLAAVAALALVSGGWSLQISRQLRLQARPTFGRIAAAMRKS